MQFNQVRLRALRLRAVRLRAVRLRAVRLWAVRLRAVRRLPGDGDQAQGNAGGRGGSVREPLRDPRGVPVAAQRDEDARTMPASCCTDERCRVPGTWVTVYAGMPASSLRPR